MIRHLFPIALVVATTVFLGPSTLGQEHRTYALFGLDSPDNGPFPSDRYTVLDDAQNTGRRVSLPPPSATCAVSISECEDLAVINELDGFNLQPRLSIPFSGPIDPNSVTSENVFLVSLGSTLQDDDGTSWGTRVGIDQVVWDPDTNTLHVESDELLDQHTRYVLVVTKRVRDENDKETKSSKGFLQFVDDGVAESTGNPDLDAYRAVLRNALTVLDTHGIVPKGQVIVASVLTTQSATAVLEKIRDQIHNAATPDAADFLLGPSGERTVFFLDEMTGVLWNQQTGTAPAFTPRTLDLSAIRTFPGAIDRVAFGKYQSPEFRVPSGYIPPIGTRTGTPAVKATNEIYFNLYLPSGPMPPDGWPVAIVGHGINGSKNIMGSYAGAPPGDRGRDATASALAAQGIASITTNAVGAGFGSLGTLTVNRMAGASVTFSAGGRGIDRDPPVGQIAANEGGIPATPRRILHFSDAFRQTAADLIQLVRVIERGMDADGDGLRDLDPSRIYFDGGSWSGGYGTVFVAVEPHIRAAVLKAPGDPVWIGPLGPSNRRSVSAILGSRQPSLLNSPGVSVFAGLPVLPATAPRFDENLPLRNQFPLTIQLDNGTSREIKSPVDNRYNDVTGDMAIQEFFDRIEWVSQAGSPVAYAPHIRKAPLQGVSAKAVLYVILKGDQTAPNPTATAIVRAGDLADRTMYYRHDLAVLDFGLQDTNPHGFNIASILPTYLQLDATFFATDGATVLQPGARYFEYPIVGPLPEDLNFIIQ